MEKETQLTLIDIDKAILRVQKKTESIQRGFLSIANDLGKLRECKAHKLERYENRYKTYAEFCSDMFGISKASLYNILSIYDHYAVNGEIPKEILDRGIRPLLAEIKESDIESTAEEVENSEITEDIDSKTTDEKIHQFIVELAGIPEFEGWLDTKKDKFLSQADGKKIKSVSVAINYVD